jgi:hypothetical protein
MGTGRGYVWHDTEAGDQPTAEPSACWSEDVMASLRLIPSDHNYSIGRRDGVCWAWIQPNDDWTPIGTQYRHDHHLGSGLVVAYTMSLASMAAAMIIIIARRGRGSVLCETDGGLAPTRHPHSWRTIKNLVILKPPGEKLIDEIQST